MNEAGSSPWGRAALTLWLGTRCWLLSQSCRWWTRPARSGRAGHSHQNSRQLAGWRWCLSPRGILCLWERDKESWGLGHKSIWATIAGRRRTHKWFRQEVSPFGVILDLCRQQREQKEKLKPKTNHKIPQLPLFLISPTSELGSSGCFQKLKTLYKWIHACSQIFIRKAFLVLRTLFHICFFWCSFQTGDICAEKKVSADTELHIKSCVITPHGEIQIENKSRLLQMELAFGSS